MIRAIYMTVLLCFLTSAIHAEEVQIVLWNGEQLFTAADVQAKADELKEFADEMKPDILLIDEVCSLDVVYEVRNVMGLDGYHVRCSDFNQNDGNEHGSFEVGIISRFRPDHVVEYDQTPDNKLYFKDGEPNELPLTADPFLKLGVKQASVGRGFLWARFDDLKITLCVTHLKSSRSGDEKLNGMKREFVAAAMAGSVLSDMETFPGYSYLVIGDLNVGPTDDKSGKDLDDDVEDGHDDTHAILGGGLVRGLKMKNLTKDVGETYDSDGFPGVGPIDNIYVAGERSGEFKDTAKSGSTYGSDHFAVYTTYTTP